MARHHIRDNEGNLHIYNDEEYKQYKYNKGCLGVVALLIFLIGGIVSTCNDDKKNSSTSQEKVVNSEIQNHNEEDVDNIDMNKLVNKYSQLEESEAIETQTTIDENDDKSIVQEETLEESYSNEVINDDYNSEIDNELTPEDQKLLKKQQKEERKRQKQMEKDAKRKAKEAEKEAKRKAKEAEKEAKRITRENDE